MTFQDGLHKTEQCYREIAQANQSLIDIWQSAFLFTWNWWLTLFFLLVPWILWFFIRNKEQTARLLFAGLTVVLFSTTLDTIGMDLGKWIYPIKTIPIGNVGYWFRYSTLPVSIMLLLQFKPHIHPLIKAVVFAGFGAYIGMPLLSVAHLYQKLDWAYTYSFFTLIFMYLMAHWVSRRQSFASFKTRS